MSIEGAVSDGHSGRRPRPHRFLNDFFLVDQDQVQQGFAEGDVRFAIFLAFAFSGVIRDVHQAAHRHAFFCQPRLRQLPPINLKKQQQQLQNVKINVKTRK